MSLGPAFPEYLSHRGILVLGQNVDGMIPLLLLPSLPRQGPAAASGSASTLLRTLAAIAVMLLSHSGFGLVLCRNIPNNVFGNMGLGIVFLCESKRPVYFSGYVCSVTKDAMATVGTEQRCTKLSGMGDDRGVFEATQGSLGLCCLRTLLDPQMGFLHLGDFRAVTATV